jgi:hypothetical protein
MDRFLTEVNSNVCKCFRAFIMSSRDIDGVPGLSEKENKMCKSMENQFMKSKKRKRWV